VYQIESGETPNLCNRDVPWLSESPAGGSLSALGEQVIDVTFDASVPAIDQPGVYFAQLKFKQNTPYLVANIPVTMTVLPLEYGVAISPDMALHAVPGETVTYTVQVTNISEGPPDSFHLVLSTSAWPANLDQAVVGPLAQGEAAFVHVAVQIPDSVVPGESDSLLVTATSQGDPTKFDTALLTTTADQPKADLSLSKAAAPGDVMVGSVLTYTLTVANAGPTLASPVTLVDVLPPGVDYLGDDGGCTALQSVVTCVLSRLKVGEVRILHLWTSPRWAGKLINRATVSFAYDSNRVNNRAEAIVYAFAWYFLPLIYR
jgi:uncharacterized repeat protein (TIGR01451 family)